MLCSLSYVWLEDRVLPRKFESQGFFRNPTDFQFIVLCHTILNREHCQGAAIICHIKVYDICVGGCYFYRLVPGVCRGELDSVVLGVFALPSRMFVCFKISTSFPKRQQNNACSNKRNAKNSEDQIFRI